MAPLAVLGRSEKGAMDGVIEALARRIVHEEGQGQTEGQGRGQGQGQGRAVGCLLRCLAAAANRAGGEGRKGGAEVTKRVLDAHVRPALEGPAATADPGRAGRAVLVAAAVARGLAVAGSRAGGEALAVLLGLLGDDA